VLLFVFQEPVYHCSTPIKSKQQQMDGSFKLTKQTPDQTSKQELNNTTPIIYIVPVAVDEYYIDIVHCMQSSSMNIHVTHVTPIVFNGRDLKFMLQSKK
jgi:hypothetical protein